jgi:hypothetical protein
MPLVGIRAGGSGQPLSLPQPNSVKKNLKNYALGKVGRNGFCWESLR